MRKLLLTMILAAFVCSSIAATADTSLPASFSTGNPSSVINSSDPIDSLIDMCLIIMVSLTVCAGCLKLYFIWKEKREAAREDARERELWK